MLRRSPPRDLLVCGHGQEVIPFPLPDGSVRFVPVLGEARQPLQRELGDVGRLAPAVTGVGVLVPFRLRARVLPRTPLRTVGACRKSAAEPKECRSVAAGYLEFRPATA
jgi:hypothetical protein